MKFTRRFRLSALAVGAAAVLAIGGLLTSGMASASPSAAPNHPAASSSGHSSNYYITFYGYTDNNPPGTAITHSCIHNGAGGTGTYDDPVTYAQGDTNGPWCQKIYIPFLKKYFIHEDSECGDSCDPSSKTHVDLWMGGDSKSTQDPEQSALINCEDQWTTHNTVVLNPPKTEPVDPKPLFTPPTTCHGGQGD